MKIFITGGSGFIGTNLIETLIEKGIAFINIDWNPPLDSKHAPFWKYCDIMDKATLQEIFFDFEPTAVIHLAARTDTDIYDLDGDLEEYIQNTMGTQHVLECIKNTTSVKTTIITSSMFVCEAGFAPEHDQEYKPFTLYGVSKMLTEQYTREADLSCTWTIIRPQTIWGPHAYRYQEGLFKVIEKGLYVHPDKKDVFRAYGYVGNVVWQILQILKAPDEQVHQQVFYVGDAAVNLYEWVRMISIELTRQEVKVIPATFVKLIALAGDFLNKFKVGFPITTTRFNSMTQDYLTSIDKTYRVLGKPPYSMEEGIKDFIKWYKKENKASDNHLNKRIKVAVEDVKIHKVAELQ